jgi:tetratricopeptide (TPR) repeat protein/SAM-dependent methyltransferase
MNRKDRRAAGKQSGAPTPAGPFGLAVRHHQAGQLFEAEALYRQVLAVDRNHFGSLHHLGILALQRGQPMAALDVLGRAIAVDGRVPDCQYNMAFALQSVGRLDEAADHYRQAVGLKPDYVDAHTNLGNVLNALGKIGDAVLSYQHVVALAPSAQAHYNLANALARLARMDEAVAHFGRSLALAPDLVGAHNNLANALVLQGRTEEALIHFERALALDPNLVEARVNLGTTLSDLGRLEAAMLQFERSLAIDPNFPNAHANLGNVFLAQGRLPEAEQCFRRALALQPDLVEALNNLGIVLAARGDFAEAGRLFQEALARKPDFVDGYNNLARAFLSMGQADHALGALRRALAIREATETKSLIVQCVRVLPSVPDVDDFRALMVRALLEPWGRANDLAAVAARVVKQDSAIKAGIARVAQAWPRRLPMAGLLGSSDLVAVTTQPLLRGLMESAAIADCELERLLTALRSALCEIAAADATADRRLLDFCCALARQCFLNEQVFPFTEEEIAAAQRLRDAVATAIASGTVIPEFRLAVVAAYFPLHALPGAGALLDRSWSDAIGGVLTQQVREPAEEHALRASMPVLTAIDDEVSHQVQRQYEENPYPRWEKSAPPSPPLAFDQYLRRKLPAAVFHPLAKSECDVLIAGCGTGQHAIETAQRFAGCRVLAVDLSLTSLVYAIRKTGVLGRTNIAYGQADILALGALGRSFDIIEASGVLHHLADPLAGWRVLLSLLRPGGFMTIGLYSEIARAEVVAARAFIAARGYPSTAAAIRQCRQDILDQGLFQDIAASEDFFSISGCRDLLFHVQEHRLTIPWIAEFLAANDLAFVGFDLDHATPRRYQERFPHDKAMTDLASWDIFEREHPKTFAGMYQFWMQKKP